MGQSNYNVIIEDYAKSHYGKKFEKKYKAAWKLTLGEIEFLCQHIDNVLKTNRADLIKYTDSAKLVKLGFSVHGTRISPKASGNRAILFVVEDAKPRGLVRVLLLYSKNEICAPNETVKWLKIVFGQYHEIRKILEGNS